MCVIILSIFYTICVLPDLIPCNEDSVVDPYENCPPSDYYQGPIENPYEEIPDNRSSISGKASLKHQKRFSSSCPSLSYQSLYPPMNDCRDNDFEHQNVPSIHSSCQDYEGASTTNVLNRSVRSIYKDRYNYSVENYNNEVKKRPSFFETLTDAIRTTFRKRENNVRAMIIANIIANSLSAMLFSGKK